MHISHTNAHTYMRMCTERADLTENPAHRARAYIALQKHTHSSAATHTLSQSGVVRNIVYTRLRRTYISHQRVGLSIRGSPAAPNASWYPSCRTGCSVHTAFHHDRIRALCAHERTIGPCDTRTHQNIGRAQGMRAYRYSLMMSSVSVALVLYLAGLRSVCGCACARARVS